MQPHFLFATTMLSLFAVPLMRGQAPEVHKTLVIAGHPGQAAVVQLNGKSYVAVEDLARAMRGSLSFTATQVVLTLPSARSAAGMTQTKQGFSREFLRASIEQMSEIREWRVTIANAIQNNSPVPEGWITDLSGRASKTLALAGAARSTEDDRSAHPLLAAEMSNMQKLSDDFLAKRRQLQYIDPKSMENDRLNQQILSCARGLAAMAADEQFRDEPSCRAVR